MKFATCEYDGQEALAVLVDGELRGLRVGDAGYPGSLQGLIEAGPEALAAAYARLAEAPVIPDGAVRYLPVLTRPKKIFCIGLNYADHAAENNLEVPDYPIVFVRFASGLIGHGAPMIRPNVSDMLDYEAELAVIIGRRGRHISAADALDYVAGYSVFNDGSVRDFQTKTTQWTIGKNFDGTAGFGPFLVTPEELPKGAAGLKIETRVNGDVMQSSSTGNLIFDVATLIETISAAITLEPGDVIATGTPAGVAIARNPSVYMKPGDVCEIEIEGVGLLVNPIEQERAA